MDRAFRRSTPSQEFLRGRNGKGKAWRHSGAEMDDARLETIMRETTKRNIPSEHESPLDNEALRASLMRKLADTLGRARRCPERACRRKRGCASPRFTCMELAGKRARPHASDHQAASLAMLKRMLNERLGEGREPEK